MKFKLVEMADRADETNATMEIMAVNNELQDAPMVGSFWYDVTNKELFGVYSVLADDVQFYGSQFYKANVRTGRKLHKDIWTKEHYRGKDKRFNGDYTQVPRGRVIEFENEGFKVYVGDWIDKYPECKEMVIDEFQLLADKTTFVKDIHWNLGHGWSDVMQ